MNQLKINKYTNDNLLLQIRNKLIVLCLIAYLPSCIFFEATPTFCYVKNDTKEKIRLYLYFNREKLEDIFVNKSYLYYLDNFDKGRSFTCVSKESLDTTNLIGMYEIDPNCFFDVYRKQSSKIEFIFDKIQIITQKDTIYFDGYDQIIKAFKEIDKNHYELQIKSN